MGELALCAFSSEALRRAWNQVLRKDLSDGEMSASVDRFQAGLEENLAGLASDLANGDFRAHDLTRFVLRDAGNRVLDIPAVRDRLVERALLEAITPHVDPLLGPVSYAYRPGLGVTHAVAEVARLRDEGLSWVLRTDVDNCFPSIPVGLARRRLGALIDDEAVLEVVDELLARPSRDSHGARRTVRGLAQGCSLSPLLANLVLVDLDEGLLNRGFSVVRYADDVAVMVETEADAWEAAREAAKIVEGLHMALGADKTKVTSFAEGFTFLGEDFGPRYPPALNDTALEEPDRKVVYVAAQGARVRTQRGRLIVESSQDTELLDAPSGHVRRLVLYGSVGLSSGARSWAMTNEVDVVFASRRGSYLGTLLAADSGPRADRLRRQLSIAESPIAVTLGQKIVEAKIRKQIVVLQRFGRRTHRDQVSQAVSTMTGCLRMLSDCTSPMEVMGLEGAAAAAYFPALGALMPEPLQFINRSRRPPLDVANAALSFLYTVLMAEAVTGICAAGMDPGIGVLHADDEHRPSLALDLMEEFRPLIVDQVVLEAARQQRLTVDHQRHEDGRGGVLLTKAGRDALLSAYERRMQTTTRGALDGFTGTWRRHLYRQAQRLQAAICSGCDWSGLTWR